MFDFPCLYPKCNRSFKSQSGLTRHYNSQHRELSPDSERDPALDFKTVYHPKLNGMLNYAKVFFVSIILVLALPCNRHGNFISIHSQPSPPVAPDATPDNPWHPFEGRLSFDWAYYNFVELQASERKINKGLDLWLAARLEVGNNTPIPWSSTTEMYATIDSIQEGNAPFQTIQFKYSEPIPDDPPRWMTQTYELCTCNVRTLLHNQLRTTDFKDEIDIWPYRQFNHKGERVWSNLMSADWAWDTAVLYIQLLSMVTQLIAQ